MVFVYTKQTCERPVVNLGVRFFESAFQRLAFGLGAIEIWHRIAMQNQSHRKIQHVDVTAACAGDAAVAMREKKTTTTQPYLFATDKNFGASKRKC